VRGLGQDLDRHIAPETRVVRAIDRTHAAGAEEGAELVGPSLVPDASLSAMDGMPHQT